MYFLYLNSKYQLQICRGFRLATFQDPLLLTGQFSHCLKEIGFFQWL